MAEPDADVTNDATVGRHRAGPVGVSGQWDDKTTYGSATVGDYDVLRLDPMNDLPPLSQSMNVVKDSAGAVDEGNWAELIGISANVTDIGLNVITYMADPLNWVLNTGLTFLIDWVQPLEDMIDLVTGNAERMGAEITKWERVGEALAPLAAEIRAAADEGLAGWSGVAAEAAKARLHEFAGAVGSLTNDVDELKFIMNIIRTLMETAHETVIAIVATFTEWLIFTWTAALASAVPTAGASTAAAAASTGVMYSVTGTRIAMFITRVVAILKRLRLILTRLHRSRMKRVQAGFQRRAIGSGGFDKGFKGHDFAIKRTMKDWRTWSPPGVTLVSGLIDDGKTLVQQSDRTMTDEEQQRKLGQG